MMSKRARERTSIEIDDRFSINSVLADEKSYILALLAQSILYSSYGRRKILTTR